MFILVGLSVLIISLSLSYYLLIYLPKRDKNYDIELKNIQKDLHSVPKEINTIDINSRLEEIESNQRIQDRERRSQNDCESTGGEYQGGGICVYR